MGVFLPCRERVPFHKPLPASTTSRLLLLGILRRYSLGNGHRPNPLVGRLDFQEFQTEFGLFEFGQPLMAR